jgi:hypothetical protein
LRNAAPLAKSTEDYQRLQQMTGEIKSKMNQQAPTEAAPAVKKGT